MAKKSKIFFPDHVPVRVNQIVRQYERCRKDWHGSVRYLADRPRGCPMCWAKKQEEKRG